MPVNPVLLTDAQVRTSFAQMEHAIMMQAQAIMFEVNRHDFREKTHWFAEWLTGCETTRG